jgi:hypothetical protein
MGLRSALRPGRLGRFIEDADDHGIRRDLVSRGCQILAMLIVTQDTNGVKKPPGLSPGARTVMTVGIRVTRARAVLRLNVPSPTVASPC